MKHTIRIILSLVLSPTFLYCTSGWSSSHNDKQQTNYYGTLTTHQGQTDTIEHILVEGKDSDIIMFDAPVKHADKIFNNKTKYSEIKLEANPITDFVKSKVDLSAISTLRVPTPSLMWVYQKERKSQRQEFLLVQVTAKESNQAKDYLLEYKTKISCISVNKNDAPSQKKEVPLAAIDTLTIEGYSFSVGNHKKDVVKEDGSCPMVKTETKTTTEVVVK